MRSAPLLAAGAVLAQQPDSLRTVQLGAVEVIAPRNTGVRPAGDTLGAHILAGKRSEIITPSALPADLSLNQARQVFAKVPGITVWENDGSGIQLGIAARGLSPNRSWEFNMRQDGHDICADVFGYPEAYYTPPMAALERIEVVRGAASLAFGPQFGGLINFVLKKGPADRPLGLELRQTAGSYGLFDNYTSLGGTKGRWNYLAFFNHRTADGWRANGRYTTSTGHASVRHTFSRRLRLGFEYTRSEVVQQQPGGLTEAQFAADPRSSVRARNWMLLPWNVAAATAEWRPDDHTLVDVKLFGTLAERNSVGFVRPITEADTINTSTGAYAPRQVDRDSYTNLGLEVRVRRGWGFMGRQAYLAVGARGYGADNLRRQQGKGSTGSDPDLSVTGNFGRDLVLSTRNAAVHGEVLLPLTDRLIVVPGMRFEHIVARVEGTINTVDAVASGRRLRQRPLFGTGVQYRTSPTSNLYANFSQAYRPVLHSDLTPSATTDVIDPDLKDASGFNLDGGIRGTLGETVQFDLGAFVLHYNDRIGTIVKEGANFRTNLGASVSRGAEVHAEADLLHAIRGRATGPRLSLAVTYAYVDARYTRWNDPATTADPARDIVGNRVEYAPEHILRPGLSYRDRRLSAALQASVISGVFTNASNTKEPNAAATFGWLPGYTVLDASATWTFSEAVAFTFGTNNLLDEAYATRRAGGYPGPGLLPGTGRTFYLTLAARF